MRRRFCRRHCLLGGGKGWLGWLGWHCARSFSRALGEWGNTEFCSTKGEKRGDLGVNWGVKGGLEVAVVFYVVCLVGGEIWEGFCDV